MPKVSVVIPTYNNARFLGEAIQSVLDQTFGDFELIVVDDGSTDNPKELVDSFADPRVKYIYQENRGAPAAYNRGLKLSRGEYVTFLDSDDTLLKDALEKGVEVLDKHPGVGFSYGQADMTDENGCMYRVRKSSFLDHSTIVDSKEQIRELLFFNRITSSTVIARRHCLDEVGGFHEGLRNIAEDHHLYIRLAKRHPVAYIAEPLVKYRAHPDQLHRRVDPSLAEKAFLLILEEVFEAPDLAPHFQPWRSQAYSYSYRRIAGYAYGKDMSLARRYLRKAIMVYPQVLLQPSGLSIACRYAKSLLPNRLWLTLRDLKWHFLNSPRRLRE